MTTKAESTSNGIGRREAIIAGTGLAASPFMGGFAAKQDKSGQPVPGTDAPFQTKAYGSRNKSGEMAPVSIKRRKVEPHDVLIDILYCGICHSDIHTVREEWGPVSHPTVPGHEIIGRVIAVGDKVSKFRVGDIAGVGCMVDSCRTCNSCKDDREQICENGTTFTYGSPDKHGTDAQTHGGYADKIVVTEHFAIRIPPGMDLAATAPLLCAGITTFSPMQHWDLKRSQRVAIAGMGGLGHMAVKLAVARGAEVTVVTTSPDKADDAKRLGAKHVIVSTDPDQMRKGANYNDLLIATIPTAYPVQQYLNLLKPDGTLINVGAMEPLEGIHGMMLAFGRKSVAGSMIGGIAETQEVIDYCAARGITADIELVQPEQINESFEKVVNKKARYRYVIDMASLKNG